MKEGKICGVGVGTGEGTLTARAVRALREADVICLPQPEKETCRSYLAALAAVPEIEDKPCIGLPFTMTREQEKLEQIHEEGWQRLLALCREGKKVVFLTIGDPAVYSTFCYMADRARRDGVPIEVAPGVPSFVMAADSLDLPLCEGDEELHILSGQTLTMESLRRPGTLVIMKCGRRMEEIKGMLVRLEQEEGAQVLAVEECGSPDEKHYAGADAIPADSGYMTTIIVKKRPDIVY